MTRAVPLWVRSARQATAGGVAVVSSVGSEPLGLACWPGNSDGAPVDGIHVDDVDRGRARSSSEPHSRRPRQQPHPPAGLSPTTPRAL